MSCAELGSAPPSLVRVIKRSNRKAHVLQAALVQKAGAERCARLKLKAAAGDVKELQEVVRMMENEAVASAEAVKVGASKLQEREQAFSTAQKHADLAGEALVSANLAHERREDDFRAFYATANKTISETISRAEVAEGSLATAEAELRSQQAASRQQVKHLAALQRAVERRLGAAEVTLLREQVASRQKDQDLADLRGQYSVLLRAFNEAQGDLAALQSARLEMENRQAAWQQEYSAVQDRLAVQAQALAVEQQEHSTFQQRASAVLSDAEGRVSAAQENANRATKAVRRLEAQLTRAAQVPARAVASAPVTGPSYAAFQVASHLRPVVSWVMEVAQYASLPIVDSVVIDHFVKNGSNANAVEAAVKELQAQALGAMPGVQRPHDEKERFIAFVEQGPPGWLSPHIVPQGHTRAKASNVRTGIAPFSGVGSAMPVTNAASSAFGMRSTSSSFPSSAPASAPAFAPAPAVTPAFATATTMATNTTAAPGAPSAPVAAPIPATLGARAVNGGKAQQSDSIGPTSVRSRRRIGP